MGEKLVAVVMGSKSDLPTVEKTLQLLQSFEIGFEVRVLSAHRAAAQTVEYAASLRDRGSKVVIAAAGKSAALAGVLAGCTELPVIGIPIKSSTLDGLDSLLSTVQMPAGIPVASVAIGEHGAKNAAILALQILALENSSYRQTLVEFRQKQTADVLATEVEGY